MIEKKTQISTSEFSKQLEKLILKKYHHLLNVFFIQTFDQLTFHQFYNHKIELISKNSMNFNSLYKQSAEKLLTIKKYFMNNLHKKFIMFSQALFTFSILFVRKHDEELIFCINYQKLNVISKKINICYF